jgi:HK97 family phage major capsid protein
VTNQELIDSIRSDWEQFKAANDAREAEIKRFGAATAETTAKVERINAAIEANQAALTQRIDDLETRLNRPLAGGGRTVRADDKLMQVYARWQSTVQQRAVDPGQVDMDLIQNYTVSFRDWMRHGDRAESKNLRLLNEMSVASAPDGGYFVSPDTSGRIETMVYESSPIRQLASVQTISSESLEGINDLDEAGASWVGETQARAGNTDTPQVALWKIPVHEQYAEPRATQKLLDDSSVDVEGWLAGKVTAKFARSEATAFVTGSGILQPRGFTTYTAGTPTAALWDRVQQVATGAAAALTADGLIDLVFSLKSAYAAGSVFGMARLTEATVRKFKDGEGNYMWQPNFGLRTSGTLLGFPIVEMADMAAVAAGTLPIVFGNLRAAYQIVDRFGVRVLRDPYTTKGYVKFYTTKRVGGGVTGFEAIKLQVVSA